MQPKKVWEVAEPAPGRGELARDLGLSELAAQLLIARAIDTVDAARSFLAPSLAQLSEPFLLPGMAVAAERLLSGARSGERIVVYGDFDVDGMTATALLTEVLASLGADVTPFIPHRFDDGYGLSKKALGRLARKGAELVVTVDCGISGVDEAQECARLGMELIITDHHEPQGGAPRALAVVDPKLPGTPARAAVELAGVGVAFKLAWALIEGAADIDRLDPLSDHPLARVLDLVALGTVADLVPLTGENRALVVAGLERLNGRPRPGLAALVQAAGLTLGTVTSQDAAFGLSPRLNAAGRLGKAETALGLLTTVDPAKAADIAKRLTADNDARRAVEKGIFEEAFAMALATVDPERDRVIVLEHAGWHEGVKGIVASRLVDAFARPTFLFTADGRLAKGSGRSIDGLDLHAVLMKHRDLYERFGGHAGAAGVTLERSKLSEFKQRLEGDLAALPEDLFTPRLAVDAEVGLAELGDGLLDDLDRLAPFGTANPVPVLAARRCGMAAASRVGDGTHLRFELEHEGSRLQAIAFRLACIDAAHAHDGAVDVAFTVSRETWRGEERVQLKVVDLVLHGDGDTGGAAGGDAPPYRARSPRALEGGTRPPDRDVSALTAETRAMSVETSPPPAHSAFLADLFARGRELCSDEDYKNIGDADAFFTKVVGVTFEGRQEVALAVCEGDELSLRRQPDNEHDANAVGVHVRSGEQLGYLNARLAKQMAPLLDGGVPYRVEVASVSGGDDGQSRGVNVLLARTDREDARLALMDDAAHERARLMGCDAAERRAAIDRALLGGRAPREVQAAALESLREDASTLLVMGTGRGKSYVFQARAAELALSGEGCSVFVYPLRALASDQLLGLSERLGPLGVTVASYTGELPIERRAEAFGDLAAGRIDIVITTPEFLSIHRERFALARVKLLVIDEAHHVARASQARRPAYLAAGDVAETLGSPTVLACTATCGDAEAAAIKRALRIERMLVDRTVRENLKLTDERRRKDRHAYLRKLASSGDKLIVYVNSREATVTIAEHLRSNVPGLAEGVAFYNGGLGKDLRLEVESRFRDGRLSCVVATSAFGEGIDIPDVRNVVLFHMPFSRIDYNQQAGRAGRDGKDSRIHVLFGPEDAKLNLMVLESSAPGRPLLAELYRVLRDLAGDEGMVERAWGDIAAEIAVRDRKLRASDRSVGAGIRILEELELIDVDRAGSVRRVRLKDPDGGKRDLDASARFAEGREEKEAFEAFRTWVLESPADELGRAVDRPIVPTSA